MVNTHGDAHPHVRECPRNPKKGEYFNEISLFLKLRAEDKRRDIICYLRTLPTQLQRAILMDIQKDLQDIGIHLSPDDIQ